MSLSEVWWLQQTEVDVPSDDTWLSAAEVGQAERFRFPKRRSDWRLGRWTVKRAVAICLGLPQDFGSLALTEIRPAASGAPEVFILNRPAEVAISLSHRDKVAMCAVAVAGVQLGCDLEVVESHGEAFVRDYFTPEEQALVASSSDRDLLVALVWSAKESALKTLQTGLREDTRSISVCAVDPLFANGSWAELSVRIHQSQLLSGWWQRCGRLVRTLTVAPAVGLPIELR